MCCIAGLFSKTPLIERSRFCHKSPNRGASRCVFGFIWWLCWKTSHDDGGFIPQAVPPCASPSTVTKRPWLDRALRLNGCLYQPMVWWGWSIGEDPCENSLYWYEKRFKEHMYLEVFMVGTVWMSECDRGESEIYRQREEEEGSAVSENLSDPALTTAC